MPTKKQLIEYDDDYGVIPDGMMDRVYELLENMNDKTFNNFKSNIQDNLNTEWKEISFIFYFLPKATPRARFSKFGGHFYVNDAKNNQKLMLDFCKNQLSDFPMITTACKFHCDVYFPTPKTMTKEEKLRAELKYIRHLSKPDWDNIGKTYSDMVQNSIILDDSLIIEGSVSKYYSIKPRIEITIEYADRYDSKFNKKSITNRKQYKDNIEKIIKRR